jgi:hypothetical protein
MSSIFGRLIVSAEFAASVIAFDQRILLASFLKRSASSGARVLSLAARAWSAARTSLISVAFGSVFGSYSHGRVLTTTTFSSAASARSMIARIDDLPEPHEPETPTVTGSSFSRARASRTGAAMSEKPSRSRAVGLSDQSGVGFSGGELIFRPV